MKTFYLSLWAAVLLCISALSGAAQEPMLSIFKENYVTTGIPLNAKPDWDTNDASFQISVRFNAFRNIGRRDWDMFFAYSQLSIWDAYRPSNPFKSNIYAPGVYLYHPFTRDAWGIKSDILMGLEHRSNGLASHDSRSINFAFVALTQRFGACFTGQLVGRFGVGSIGNKVSLEMFNRYQGYVHVALCLHTPDRRFMATATADPLFNGAIPANLGAELAFRLTRRADWFYLIARYHYGFDEYQLESATEGVFLKHMVRFGLAVQPSILSHKLFF